MSLERAHNIEDALKMRVAPKTSCPQCITVDNCSLGFNDNNNILSNISFKLTEGTGSLSQALQVPEKPSLLKMISGIVKPCEGCVSSGKDIWFSFSKSRRSVVRHDSKTGHRVGLEGKRARA